MFENGEGLVGVLLPSNVYSSSFYLQGSSHLFFSHYVLLRKVLYLSFNVELKCLNAHVCSFLDEVQGLCRRHLMLLMFSRLNVCCHDVYVRVICRRTFP